MGATHHHAVITGGSRGIGFALARQFAGAGFDLVLIARHEDALRRAADDLGRRYGVKVTPLAEDLSRPSAAETIATELEARSIDVEILVNNAGFGTHGPFAELSLERELSMLRLNVVCLTELTRGSGRILNVSSTAGLQPTPLMATYGASKAYALHFSEALAAELRGSGVTVTVLCPGAVRTGFQAQAGVESVTSLERYAMQPDRVAAIAFRSVQRGRTIVVPGWRNRLMAFGQRFVPRRVVRRLAYRYLQEDQDKPNGAGPTPPP